MKVKFSVEELQEVAAAAEAAELAVAAYVGDTVVRVARAVADGGSEGEAGRVGLARIQRELFAARTALVAAAAALEGVGGSVAECSAAVARLDELAGEIHGRLRRWRS
ncbi:hypothetical protein GCM10027187_74820 [Streptosporangium sandarakinum]